MIEENSPFVEDFYQCLHCGDKAKYQCPNCGNLKFCDKCSVKKAGKSLMYCPRCLFRLYEIPLRWVGSVRPLRKWHADAKSMKAVYVAPKICPKCDRDRINEQKRGEG